MIFPAYALEAVQWTPATEAALRSLMIAKDTAPRAARLNAERCGIAGHSGGSGHHNGAGCRSGFTPEVADRMDWIVDMVRRGLNGPKSWRMESVRIQRPLPRSGRNDAISLVNLGRLRRVRIGVYALPEDAA